MFQQKLCRHVLILMLSLFVNGVQNCYSSKSTNSDLTPTEILANTTTIVQTITINSTQKSQPSSTNSSIKTAEITSTSKKSNSSSRNRSRKLSTRSSTIITSPIQNIFKSKCNIVQAASKIFGSTLNDSLELDSYSLKIAKLTKMIIGVISSNTTNTSFVANLQFLYDNSTLTSYGVTSYAEYSMQLYNINLTSNRITQIEIRYDDLIYSLKFQLYNISSSSYYWTEKMGDSTTGNA